MGGQAGPRVWQPQAVAPRCAETDRSLAVAVVTRVSGPHLTSHQVGSVSPAPMHAIRVAFAGRSRLQGLRVTGSESIGGAGLADAMVRIAAK